jgi:flagellar L-ring protein precursor FlgH
MRVLLVCCLIAAIMSPAPAAGKKDAGKKDKDKDKGNAAPKKGTLSPLEQYLQAYSATAPSPASPNGSLWNPQNSFSELSADDRARSLNDLLTIRIVEQTTAQNTADVTAQRKLSSASSITGVAGQTVSQLNPILALNSDNELTGKGQADTGIKLQTSVTGRIVAVLPNGSMVVEAERRVHMNNETQTIVLRGMVRPADVQPDNSVVSTALSNLEIELKGKGVISDSSRPSNKIVRAILWLTGF